MGIEVTQTGMRKAASSLGNLKEALGDSDFNRFCNGKQSGTNPTRDVPFVWKNNGCEIGREGWQDKVNRWDPHSRQAVHFVQGMKDR